MTNKTAKRKPKSKRKPKPQPLSAAERGCLNELFAYLEETFSSSGCNDWCLPNTKEGRALCKAIEDHCVEDPEERNQDRNSYITFDSMALEYIAYRLDEIMRYYEKH